MGESWGRQGCADHLFGHLKPNHINFYLVPRLKKFFGHFKDLFRWIELGLVNNFSGLKSADRPTQSPIEQCVTVAASAEDVVTFSNISEKTESPLCGKATAFLCWHGGDSLPIPHKGGMQIKQWKGRGACLQHGCNKERSRRNPSSVGTNRCEPWL